MVNIPIVYKVCLSQVVQDFFHQQYLPIKLAIRMQYHLYCLVRTGGGEGKISPRFRDFRFHEKCQEISIGFEVVSFTYSNCCFTFLRFITESNRLPFQWWLRIAWECRVSRWISSRSVCHPKPARFQILTTIPTGIFCRIPSQIQ